MHRFFFLFVAIVVLSGNPVFAQNVAPEPAVDPGVLEDSFITDNNGNGTLDLIAFGDSITRGVGDFTPANEIVFDPTHPEVEDREAGFPLRMELLLQLPVSNLGRPGEIFTTQGLRRFANRIPSLRPDVVIVSGGANDAREGVPTGDYFRALQTMLNIARASGVQPMLWTISPTCCNHSSQTDDISSYNDQMRALSVINDVPLADIAHGFNNVCGSTDCRLLNRPEGLHPNTEGYDIMGELITAGLLKIDLFTPTGARRLESALNLPEGTVKTPPDMSSN